MALFDMGLQTLTRLQVLDSALGFTEFQKVFLCSVGVVGITDAPTTFSWLDLALSHVYSF